MNSEYEILSHLQNNEETSQRKIASKTGLSVGTVNLLLKKMVRKGLVKIERLNAKTLRYIITPQGMIEKSRLVYHYIKDSYNQISTISNALSRISAVSDGGQKKEMIFYGPPNEVLEILKLSATNLGIKYYHTSEVEIIRDKVAQPGIDKLVIIIWDAEYQLKSMEEIEIVNIFFEI